MTELDLHKFIEEYDCMTRNDGKLPLIWVSYVWIDEFMKMLSYNLLDEGGLVARLQEDYICIDLDVICEFYDIDVNNVIAID